MKDLAFAKRKLENAEFVLQAYQRHAELVNVILEHIDNGTIDQYCQEETQRIREQENRVTRLKLELLQAMVNG